jgi:uncharacterized membrane protein
MTNETTNDSVPAKQWGESMTVWGVLLTAASTLLLVIGPLLGLDTTAELIEQLGRQLTEIVLALGGIIGTLIAIYGLVRATQAIVCAQIRHYQIVIAT